MFAPDFNRIKIRLPFTSGTVSVWRVHRTDLCLQEGPTHDSPTANHRRSRGVWSSYVSFTLPYSHHPRGENSDIRPQPPVDQTPGTTLRRWSQKHHGSQAHEPLVGSHDGEVRFGSVTYCPDYQVMSPRVWGPGSRCLGCSSPPVSRKESYSVDLPDHRWNPVHGDPGESIRCDWTSPFSTPRNSGGPGDVAGGLYTRE